MTSAIDHYECRSFFGFVIARSLVLQRRQIVKALFCSLAAQQSRPDSCKTTHDGLPPHTVAESVSPVTETARHRLLQIP